MALESATYISELVDTNPTVSDPVGQGDDHLKLIKTVLKTQFSGLAGTTAITTDESEMNLLDGGYEGTAVVSTGESAGTKFLREDGDTTCSWQSIPAGTTINSNADNRVITGSGTADTLNGESGLTYNGSVLTVTGNILPEANGTRDLGASGTTWANVYSSDLHLDNTKRDGNEVDGSVGSWTIQEGSDDLFLLNRKNGKKYKFTLQEV